MRLLTDPRIVSDPAILLGKPTVRGTGVTVEHLLHLAASGLTLKIVEEHPRVMVDDVSAAYSFAAEMVRDSWLKEPS